MNEVYYILNLADKNVQKGLLEAKKNKGKYNIPIQTMTDDEVMYNFSRSVFSDLINKKYSLFYDKKNKSVKVQHPNISDLYPEAQKSFVRETLLQEKHDQLKKPSIMKFISTMETNRVYNGKWISIFSLMREGREFAKSLESLKKGKNYGKVIKPYLQFIETGDKCKYTGLQLNDIWRYFRFTWSTPNKSVPGRNINILIRDAALDYHPIIGIASIGSSVIQQSERDKWIGWHSDVATKLLSQQKSPGKWVLNTLDKMISELYLKDLMKEKILNLTKKSLNRPNEQLIKRLKQAQQDYMQLHRSSAKKKSKIKNDESEDIYWVKEAKSYLFKSKRCGLLAKLLECRLIFNSMKSLPTTKNSFIKALRNRKYKEVVVRLVHLVKSEKVGINIMDIMVCGAISPYNHILGGKLVSMMLTSPEVSHYYKKKYEEYSSVIASSMAGKPVKRENDLVYLGVTSLYGISSSQYNRLSISLNKLDSKKKAAIKYEKIGKTLGFTSLHLSEKTRELSKVLVNRFEEKNNENYSYVNYQFGEGTSPRLRLLNKALTIAGLTPSKLLKHYNPKIVYGVSLVNNLFEYLMGFNSKPVFYLNRKNKKAITDLFVKFWVNRWLLMRIKNKNVLENVFSESLVHPISHNGKVKMPKRWEDDFGPLFSN